MLLYVSRLVDEVEHDLILDCFRELIAVNVAPKHVHGVLAVFFEQGRPRKSDKDRVGHARLHDPMEGSALGAVALIDKHEELTMHRERLGLERGDVGLYVIDVSLAKLVNERAEESRVGLAELSEQIPSALGAVDLLIGAREDLLDLRVELIAVGDEGDASVRVIG